MSRIRTVKPEFWSDEVVGTLPPRVRLLFIATWNLADDEGLLGWTAKYLRATAFMYDDDVTSADVEGMMASLAAAGLVFPYTDDRGSSLAYVVNFRRHQRINRAMPTRLCPPSVDDDAVREMYVRRDRECLVCHRRLSGPGGEVSLVHLKPRDAGGSDAPSNVRAVHAGCARSLAGVSHLRQSGQVTAGGRPKVGEPGAGEDFEGDGAGRAPTVIALDGAGRGRRAVAADGMPVGELADETGEWPDWSVEVEEDGMGLYDVAVDPFTPPAVRTYTPDPMYAEDVERLCTMLADRVRAAVPPGRARKVVVRDSWRKSCELLLRNDKCTPDQVAAIIEWSTRDPFWRSNILSMPALRKNFDRLSIAVNTPRGAGRDRPRRLVDLPPETINYHAPL